MLFKDHQSPTPLMSSRKKKKLTPSSRGFKSSYYKQQYISRRITQLISIPLKISSQSVLDNANKNRADIETHTELDKTRVNY